MVFLLTYYQHKSSENRINTGEIPAEASAEEEESIEESEDIALDSLFADDNIAIEIPPNQTEITDNDQLTEDEFENREIPEIINPRDFESVDLNLIPIDSEESNVGEVKGVVVMESSNTDVQTDIEQLITEAFKARANGNYSRTLAILETILEQDPPEEIMNLILDDIEILFAKLAS
jgi:hypothetical protein